MVSHIISFYRKCCWVCFATVEDDYEAKWVKPCRCRGTTKWVHQTCLQRWVDEKQKGNSSAEVYCPQCGTRYIIVFPEFGKASPSSQFTNTAESLRLYSILPNSSNNQIISVKCNKMFCRSNFESSRLGR